MPRKAELGRYARRWNAFDWERVEQAVLGARGDAVAAVARLYPGMTPKTIARRLQKRGLVAVRQPWRTGEIAAARLAKQVGLPARVIGVEIGRTPGAVQKFLARNPATAVPRPSPARSPRLRP